VQAIQHRLYLTAFWPLTALALVVPGWNVVAYVHDRVVVGLDFDCLKREKDEAEAALNALEAVRKRRQCNIEIAPLPPEVAWILPEPEEKIPGPSLFLRSSRAWEPVLSWQPEIPGQRVFARRAVRQSAPAVFPVVALVLVRRWLRWLLRPPAGQGADPK
jgi:hypothetical protein